MTDVTGKTFIVWDYSDILNPKQVKKTSTAAFRYSLSPAPIGATFDPGPNDPLQDGYYCVAGVLTGYNAVSYNGVTYQGAMLQWANAITGPSAGPTIGYDHSGTLPGCCLLLNCPPNTQGQKIYSRTISNLCTGKQLFFECWITVFTYSANGTYSGVNVTVNLTDGGNSSNVVSMTGTATRQADGGGVWVKIAGQISLTGNTVTMDIINNSSVSTNGNDLVLDDIKIMACAPPSIDAFFDLTNLTTNKTVCTDPLNLLSQASSMLTTYYGTTNYIYQWTKTPTDYTSWKNIGTPGTATSYSMANAKTDPSFATTTANGDSVFYRVVAASP